VEYIEQEDEFDIHPLDELQKRRLDQEDEEVDVLTVDQMQLEREGGTKFAGPDGIFRMPVLMGVDESDSEDEMVAIGAGQFRRKSTAREESELLEGDDIDTDSLQGEPNGHTGSKRRRGE
jgi:COMPASS component SWD1